MSLLPTARARIRSVAPCRYLSKPLAHGIQNHEKRINLLGIGPIRARIIRLGALAPEMTRQRRQHEAWLKGIAGIRAAAKASQAFKKTRR